MSFEAKSFVKECQALLQQGATALHTLMERYNWAVVHLKEIHKYSPEYTQDWLSREMTRVFNADPEIYVRVAWNIGGTRDNAGFRLGQSYLKRYGYWECVRADRLLTKDQMRRIPEQVSLDKSVEQFVDVVDTMAEVLRTKRQIPGPDRIDYRKEFFKLQKENTELRVQLKAAQSELKVLREWKDSMVGAK